MKSGPEAGLNAVPWVLAHSAPALSKKQPGEMNVCSTCTGGKPCQKRELQLLKSPSGHNLSLRYESSHEDCIIKKIFALGNSEGSPPMTSAFLLSLCVQHSMASLHVSELRRLLLRIASGVQKSVWVSSGQVIGNLSGLSTHQCLVRVEKTPR